MRWRTRRRQTRLFEVSRQSGALNYLAADRIVSHRRSGRADLDYSATPCTLIWMRSPGCTTSPAATQLPASAPRFP